MPPIDKAGRQIAGLLTYNPGPGIYSRLERAIQAMPENVRAQELPGLLKRYKDGVPGWELKAADLDSVIAGRDVVPRDELLGAVRERSPVYTHKEVVLGGTSQGVRYGKETILPDYSSQPSPLSAGAPHGDPKFEDYGQGGDDYTELLLVQPDAPGNYGNHWGLGRRVSPAVESAAGQRAVAHARYDTHGDALRINELQSDLGIHNRKMREQDAEYQRAARELGPRAQQMGLSPGQTLPFPMEDAWADLLIKRMALEAARKGHRAIEVASPRAIADKVGGNIDNYEHFYGKVVPGALERLGRKMGGLTPVDVSSPHLGPLADAENQLTAETREYLRQAGLTHPDAQRAYQSLVNAMEFGDDPAWMAEQSDHLFGRLMGPEKYSAEFAGMLMPELMSLASRHAQAQAGSRHAFQALKQAEFNAKNPPGRRYLMSDEMRRRLIQEGVGAAVAGGILSQDDLIERLGQ